MRPALLPHLVAIVVISSSRPLLAQSLSIGGVAIAIGDSEPIAIKRLQLLYKVKFTGSEGLWAIIRQDGRDTTVIGLLGTERGVATQIVRMYALSDESRSRDDALSSLIMQAIGDVRALGGTSCETVYQEWTGGAPASLSMKCGAYTLSFSPAGDYARTKATWGLDIKVARSKP